MSPPEKPRAEALRRLVKAGFFVVALAFVYVVSYFAIMDRSTTAIDRHERIAFRSAFRFSRIETTMKNGLTTTYACVSAANYIFAPMDVVDFGCFPGAHNRRGEEKFAVKDWWAMK